MEFSSDSETWNTVAKALLKGTRGLPSGRTLPQLLEAERRVRNVTNLPPITVELVLAWADAHYARTGSWPRKTSGPVFGVEGETWSALSTVMNKGCRGFAPGRSLAQFLSEHRGVRNRMELPPITKAAILQWADAYFERTGSWPWAKSGDIPEAPGETWQSIERALAGGRRGLRSPDSLARLLARHRGKRNVKDLRPHSLSAIHRWIRRHFRRAGVWPHGKAGPVVDAPGETWSGIDLALARGLRGLPGGSSLAIEVRKCHSASG